MADTLIFHLSATLGAMGAFAGHERRGSLTWPGRSALIGLCAAALGIRRDGDFSALEALRVSVAIFEAGEVLRDYHTVETVPTAAAKRPQSRPEALRRARGRTNTTITLRDYRQGVLFGVAITGADGGAEGAEVTLEPLCAALKRPVFPLYLGRKSCPLSSPLDPQIVEADSAEAALRQLRLPPWHQGAVARMMACDGFDGAPQQVQRHDIATDRQRWHFSARQVALVPVKIAPEVAVRKGRGGFWSCPTVPRHKRPFSIRPTAPNSPRISAPMTGWPLRSGPMPRARRKPAACLRAARNANATLIW